MSEIKNAKITGTSISMANYGCLTFHIYLEGNGVGFGYGGYVIAHGSLGYDDNEFAAENGYGLVAMMLIMNVVGVDCWEDLEGRYVRYVDNGWGKPVCKIGNIIKDKWFDIAEFFEEMKKNAEY